MIKTPENVNNILNKLNEAGFKAYLVGGCVRDSIMNRIPKDWDITTNALPEQTMRLFPHTIPTGLKHGTVSILCPNKEIVEVTTFRIDGKYTDNRHPENVHFSTNIEDDLKRRDFTINAIAYSPLQGFIDPFNGIGDIELKVVKCVGNAEERFSEDALRMMRAVRFSATLDFMIESKTKCAILKLSSLIKNISVERIREEFIKTILSENPEIVYLYKELKLSDSFLPEINKEDLKNILADISFLENNFAPRMAFLLFKCSGEITEIAQKLKFDNKTTSQITSIIDCLSIDLPETPYETRKIMADKHLNIGFKTSLDIRKALSPNKHIQKIINEYNLSKNSGHCTNLRALAINGNQLDSLGITQGKEKGSILDQLLDMVLKDPDLNIYETLVEIVQRLRSV